MTRRTVPASKGVRFIVGARAGGKGASWPFCYVEISADELLIGGWPVPWFSPRRIARKDIGWIHVTTIAGAPVMRIYDRHSEPTGDGTSPMTNREKIIDFLGVFGYQVDVT